MRAELSIVNRRAAVFGATLLSAALLPPSQLRSAFAVDESSLALLPPGSRARELLEAQMRPKLRALPRRRLEQDFAVLLMRSSYEAADFFDFMPMDEFQKEQFLFRQNEWDKYRAQLKVMQGDLTDPAYFDFISFCQYASIASGMRNGQILFNELIDANGTSIVVSRGADLPQSNAALPEAHSRRVGDRLLDWMLENYKGRLQPEVTAAGRKPSADMLIEGCRRISDIFILNDFALTSDITPLADGTGVSWTLVAPANLWGAQVLSTRGDAPRNDFEVKALLAYLRRCGVPATSTTRFEKGTAVTHEFKWAKFVLAS